MAHFIQIQMQNK